MFESDAEFLVPRDEGIEMDQPWKESDSYISGGAFVTEIGVSDKKECDGSNCSSNEEYGNGERFQSDEDHDQMSCNHLGKRKESEMSDDGSASSVSYTG